MSSAVSLPASIRLYPPSKYIAASSNKVSDDGFAPPPPEWLHRTWTVTHSTLSMWRTKRNVRITYSATDFPRAGSSPAARNHDKVEWESASGEGGIKTVQGVNTASRTSPNPSGNMSAPPTDSPSVLDTGGWDWRGKGFLFWLSSHWEVLGWGERPTPDGGVERWVVTWFTASLFTEEGVDIYADSKEGLSAETVHEILNALRVSPAAKLASLCEKDMRPVEISLPWKEK